VTLGQVVRKGAFNAINRGGQEVSRAHGDVGHSEVKESIIGGSLIQRVEPGEVVPERWFKCVFEQMLHGKVFGEVRTGGLACSRRIVEVRPPLGHDDFFLGLGGAVLVLVFRPPEW
jgi:hypothetical protein